MILAWSPTWIFAISTSSTLASKIRPLGLTIWTSEVAGVIFIPAHLANETVLHAEFVALRDTFGHQRLKEGTYTPGQIDRQWTEEIKADFLQWLDDNPDLLPMSREELDEYMKTRTW